MLIHSCSSLILLLHPLDFYFRHCTFQLQNFYLVSISLLIFLTYSYTIFLISISSLVMIFFSSLSVFKTANLKSIKSNIWASSLLFFVNLFLISLWMSHAFLLLCIPCNFLLRTGHFKYYNEVNLEIKFFPLSSNCCCCLMNTSAIPLFTDFFQTIFAETIFLAMCDHWSLCSVIYTVSQWPDRNFLKCQ